MRALRWILIGGAGLVVLAVLAIAVGTAWLNTYIHSDAFKAEVESRATKSIGGPVQIGKIDFNIFTGVKLQGLATQIDPSHSGGQGALQVNVASVSCTYAWTELLSRKLKLTGVILNQPQVVITKQSTAPPAAQALPGGPDSGAAQGEGTAMPFEFILDRARINDGSVSIRDASGASLVELKGVNVNADTRGYYLDGGDLDNPVKAKVTVADMMLPSNMHVTDFSASCSYGEQSGKFIVTPYEATAFSGKLAGDYSVQNSTVSILDLNGKGVDVAQLTAATNSSSSAKLSGSLDLQSKWRGVETGGNLNGEGDAQLTGGKVEGVKMLHDISGIFKIKELNDPVIKKAQTHFVVQNRQTKFTGLEIDSDGFQMQGDGVIGFDGSLNADMVLVLSSDSMKKLPKEVGAFFVQKPDGSASIAYHLSGTVANPQTDLAQRLFLQNMQIQNTVKKALNKLFH